MTDTAQNWYAFDAYGHCVKLGNLVTTMLPLIAPKKHCMMSGCF